MNISQLLQQEESEFLDFKECFHSSNVHLLHDILCLANSYTENDRYLVFGVRDNKSVCGIEADPNKKTNAQIQDFLRSSNFNRIPTVKLELCSNIQDHEVAVLRIKNRPDKPFYLTQDKKYQGDVIRGGVVYSRLGDTNIPLKETSPEDHIELMWRERFGLGLDPLTRVGKLLEDTTLWIKMGSESYIYHKQHPEFTIKDGITVGENFQESWTSKFRDTTAWSYYVEVSCLTTILRRILFVACDGGRYRIPAPERDDLDQGWVINLDALGYKISKIYDQYYPLHQILPSIGIRLIHPSS